MAGLLSGYFAWYMTGLVWESWRFNDLSPGIVPVPLWIAQAPLALGLVVLTIALADDFVRVARGGMPSFAADEGDVRPPVRPPEGP